MVGRSLHRVHRAWMAVAIGLSLVAAMAAPAGAALPLAQPAQEDPPVDIPARVERQVEQTGEATFWIRLDGKADLSAAAGMTDWAERGRFVYETLTNFADDAQAAVRSRLDTLGAEYHAFWISNTIRVTGNASVLTAMAAHPDVSAIDAPRTYHVPEPIPTRGEIQATEWGLDAINAPDVWNQFGVRGEGIVVANIDTGAQFDHPALVDQYRGTNTDGSFDHNYNWFDPSNVCGSPSLQPCDNDSHGTHTMGTMVGDDGAGNQIGVAPGARWIAAKGCETNDCSDFALLESGEWIVAPTDLNGQNPRPDLRPHVVNNSWGGGVGDDWYMDTVDAWIAAGIFPMIANGNAGPGCGSVSSPGDYPQSYGVGAFDINGNIASFSGRGPSAFDAIKPNVSAPGVNVRSSVPTDAYANFNGTSMATPHASGAVALMLSAAPALIGNIDETRAIIDQTAVDTEDLTCGGEPANNNVWGEGKLDALAAVEQSPRGEAATLTGTVTDAVSGDPIAGATVTATGELDRTVTTDENGAYELLLIAGSFDVTTEAYGYAPETTTVDLVAGETTTLDIALDPLPTTVVSGTVTDGSGHGWPLYARIDIDGYPLGPVFTDPVTGEYSVELVEAAEFTFNVSAVSGGYLAQTRPVTVPPDANVQDFILLVNPRNCIAPGYSTRCTPATGGMVVGNVYDVDTGDPVNDATVTVDDALDSSTETMATPEDDNLDDGFYLLFSPITGPTDITADKAFFAPTTESVDVVRDAVVVQDFQLGSGQLEVDPDSLSADVALGESTDLDLTLSNVGSGAAEFEIRERDRGRDVAARVAVPELAAPGDVEFSAPAKSGPASALSAGAQAAGVGGKPSTGPASPDWQQGAPLPAGLVRYAFATCEDNPEVFYVISGVSNGSIVNTNYRYDAATDTWTTLAPIPTGQEGPNAACFDGRIYVIGGNGTNQHFVYDIAANTWSAAAPVPRGAAMASAGAFDGKVFYIGGDNDFFPGSGVFNQVFIYDIAANSWSQGTPMPVATSAAGTAQAGEFLYVVGGWGAGAPASNVNVTQRYDMSADSWESGPEFTVAKADFALAASGDALYAIGGDSNGAGFFDASTSVHRLDLGAWPSGTWEDLEDPLPGARTANNAGFCTTAKTGGEVYSVGGFAGGVWNNQNVYRETGEGCAGAVDVPWVSEDPAFGTIDAGASLDITVTLDASVPEVDQPGTYRAELIVAEDTPRTVPPVPVTMNVAAPADWGKATGTITGLAQCDAPGAPLEGASVQIGDFTVETDEDGFYEWWLAAGTYPITVSADGYVTQTDEVVITAGGTTETSFDLRLDAPCPTVSPESFEFTVPFGGGDDGELTISNDGAAPYNFRIRERDRGRDIALRGAAPDLPAPGEVEFSAPVKAGPASAISAAARSSGVADDAAAAPAAPDWQTGAPVPAGIIRYAFATCAEAPDVFYVISGVSNGSIVNTNYRYDAATDTWTTLAPIPTGQEGPNAACFDGRIYVVGGNGTNQHFVYDIANDSWSAAAPVPQGAAMASAGAFDGKVFYIGGDNDFFPGSGVFNQVFIYDIASNSWSLGTPMPTATSGAGTVQAGEFLYVVGGWGPGAPGSNVNVTQRYDMSADSWESGPEFTVAKADFALAASAEALYAIGGDSNGAGFFDASTSVHRLDLGAWPGGTWEDLGDPLPSPRSANMAGFCTTAKAGGEVYSVGGFAGFVWNNQNVFRDTGEGCGGASDVTWLTVDPTEGTVEPGGSATAAVAVDASVPEVDQPGAYAADVVVGGAGADPISVPVTMNVTVPDNFGKATGTVTGLARCDAPGSPLDGATVQIGDFTVETDETGLYEWWLTAGTYPITVSADGYVTQTGEVVVTAGATTETSFDLRLDAPCATVSPEAIELTLPSGDSGSTELTLGNLGAAGYGFEIFETPFDLRGTTTPTGRSAAADFSAPAEIGELSVRSVEARGTAPRAQVQAPPWFGGADLPGGLVRYAHAQCDGDTNSFYVISGVNGNFALDTSTWRFDADTNSWTELAPIPTGQEGPSAVCTGGRIYVMGGGGTNQHFIYDIGTDTWSAGAPVPRNVWGAAMGAFAGKVYLMGGDSDFSPGGTSNEVNVYDIATDTWSTGPAMPTATLAPGNVQAGQHVYVVGGWGDATPGSNVDAAQRFDMSTGSWTTGPTFASKRSDLALAATGSAIYAVGGDNDGGGFFDATATAERLDVTSWPDGAWSAVDPLPLALGSNSGGFCTESILGTEVWSVAGANQSSGGITGRTFFRAAEGEACATVRADVPWLSVDPAAGDVAADGSTSVTVSVDATELADGEYRATLIVETTDPSAAELLVPVTLTVAGEPEPEAAAWVALEANGTIGGVRVTRSDIAQVNTDGSVGVYFDGSDAGLPNGAHIDAVAVSGEQLLLSFRGPVNVPGLGRVDDSDVVVYDGAGYDLWLDGSDFGLTTDSEDIDAIELVGDGTIVVSTEGAGEVPGVSTRGEDLIALDTEDTWSVYFDGSDVGLSTAQENVDAAALDGGGSLDLSTAGRLLSDGFSADDDDVAVFEPTSLGEDTAGSFTGLLINGSDLGIAINDITAVDVPG